MKSKQQGSVSKLVIASFLHRYWHKLTFGYKVGGLIFLFLVIFVTSSGVYGILSQAYTENKNKLMASKSEVALVEEKKKLIRKVTCKMNTSKLFPTLLKQDYKEIRHLLE